MVIIYLYMISFFLNIIFLLGKLLLVVSELSLWTLSEFDKPRLIAISKKQNPIQLNKNCLKLTKLHMQLKCHIH